MTAVTDPMSLPAARAQRKTPKGTFDLIFRNASFASALFVLILLAGIMLSMVIGGWPAFKAFGLGFITGSQWDTQADVYGAWPAIAGTLTTAFIALLIGVPLFAAYVQVPLSNIVEGMPIVGTILYSRSPSGLGILTAGIILAFMIIPFIASIVRDMLDQIPSVLRESAYGIGATTWEVVRHVLVPQAGVSIIGAIMLGLGRALGETMAVTFVVGNANRLSGSIMDPGSTIASRIANEFNEALGLQMNALIGLGCILFFVTFVVLVIARILVARVKTF